MLNLRNKFTAIIPDERYIEIELLNRFVYLIFD